MTPFPAVLDNSIMSDWKACGERARLADFEHWKLKGESLHLHAGAAFARGLEVTRRSFFEEGEVAMTSLGRGIAALLLAYGDFQPPEGAAKTAERMAGALEAYFDKWPLDEGAQPKLMPSGKHAIEFSFAEPLLDILHPVTREPLIYSGRADMLCDFAGGVYIEDDKTTSQLGATWANKWDLRAQFTGYCWAAQRAHIAVNGVLVRGISILKTQYGTAEAITNRSQWEIDRWYWQLKRDILRMIESWKANEWDFNLGDSCDSYGGCQFRQICKSQHPAEWLPMSFERRRWDPLTRTETPLEDTWTGQELPVLSAA